MKVVILAGGRGSRISEESRLRPKPMITIGGMPILWHIMKIYSSYGFREFIICCGYKGEYIKKFFVDYAFQAADAQFDLKDGCRVSSRGLKEKENWKIILANTGLETLTAGRLLKVREYIGNDREFMITYGDGVADLNLNELMQFHHEHGRAVTISAVRPEGRFGAIKIADSGVVESFREKARRSQSYVNMGFMVMNRSVFDYLGDGSTMLETLPFERLTADRNLAAYKHRGFWSPMDNISDRRYLEGLWRSGKAAWKIWKDGADEAVGWKRMEG